MSLPFLTGHTQCIFPVLLASVGMRSTKVEKHRNAAFALLVLLATKKTINVSKKDSHPSTQPGISRF